MPSSWVVVSIHQYASLSNIQVVCCILYCVEELNPFFGVGVRLK